MKWEKWVQQSIWRKKGGETITLSMARGFKILDLTLIFAWKNSWYCIWKIVSFLWFHIHYTDNSILSHHLDKTFPHWEDLKSFESKSLYFEWPLSYYKVCLFATLWNLLSVSSYTERTIHRCHSGPAYKWHYCQRAWQPNRYNYKSLYDCCFRYL